MIWFPELSPPRPMGCFWMYWPTRPWPQRPPRTWSSRVPAVQLSRSTLRRARRSRFWQPTLPGGPDQFGPLTVSQAPGKERLRPFPTDRVPADLSNPSMTITRRG